MKAQKTFRRRCVRFFFLAATAGFWLIQVMLLQSCTESPFEGGIAPEPKQITGQVDLVDTNNDEKGIYVWLSGLKIGAYTDSTGAFKLEMPKNAGRDLSGVFTLYFYVANYGLRTATVAVREGKFLYGAGDIDSKGRIKEVVKLFKILNIQTIVVPSQVPHDYKGPIDLLTTLQAVDDTVLVVFPKSVGGLLGGMFFRHLGTGEIYIDIADVDANTRDVVAIGREPRSRRQIFEINGSNFRALVLPVGEYIVVPFFLIEQEGLPPELIESFGEKADDLTPNFLKIPFRRNEARFKVLP
jgi:hypothetical protein